MAQTKIYCDTNTYFRLAQGLHPLLFNPFCPEDYTLYITEQFQKEFERSSRLQRLFSWVNETQYVKNRLQRVSIPHSAKRDISNAVGYFSDRNFAQAYGVGSTDIDILAHAFCLNLPVATDDRNMSLLANDFGIEIYDSLKLMRQMFDCGHILISTLDDMVYLWKRDNDLPFPGYINQYFRVFPESCMRR